MGSGSSRFRMSSSGKSKSSLAGKDASAPAKKELNPDFDLIMDEHLAKNEWPSEKMAAIKSAPKVSLMAQAMSEETFNRLKDLKSPKVCHFNNYYL